MFIAICVGNEFLALQSHQDVIINFRLVKVNSSAKILKQIHFKEICAIQNEKFQTGSIIRIISFRTIFHPILSCYLLFLKRQNSFINSNSTLLIQFCPTAFSFDNHTFLDSKSSHKGSKATQFIWHPRSRPDAAPCSVAVHVDKA